MSPTQSPNCLNPDSSSCGMSTAFHKYEAVSPVEEDGFHPANNYRHWSFRPIDGNPLRPIKLWICPPCHHHNTIPTIHEDPELDFLPL